MVYHQEIETLERQRQLLVNQCEIQRVMLALQLKELQSGTGQLAWALHWIKRTVLITIAGAAAGALVTRKRLPFRKWMMKLFLGWTLLRRAKPVWTIVRFLLTRR